MVGKKWLFIRTRKALLDKKVESKKFIGYTGPFPKPTGPGFEGLKKSLEQDEKLWVDVNDELSIPNKLKDY